MMAQNVARLTLLTAVGLLMAGGLTGCGARRCDVAGKVTYQGKPIVCGCVVIVGTDGVPITANLNQDGTYEAKSVPLGRAEVAVFSLDPARPRDPEQGARRGDLDGDAPAAPQGAAAKAKPGDRSNWMNPEVDRSKWFPIPKKFEQVQTSGLKAELHKGDNVVNLDLQ